jgi:hypothetical protein
MRADNVSAIDNLTGESCVQTRFDDRFNMPIVLSVCIDWFRRSSFVYHFGPKKPSVRTRAIVTSFLLIFMHSRTLLSWRDAKVVVVVWETQ